MAQIIQAIGLTVRELERLIKSVEPAAFLVPARLVRRVIKQHHNIDGMGLLVPHRKGYVIDRAALLKCVEPVELGLAQTADVPPFVFLLIRPGENGLNRYGVEGALIKFWRVLFHLQIDLVMQQKIASGELTPAVVRQRILRLGLTEFAEASEVLRQESYLLPPETDTAIYAEFVAVYTTMRRFDPERVSNFFPALSDVDAVDALVGEDIDVDTIFEAARLPGAPLPMALEPRVTQRDGLVGSSPNLMPSSAPRPVDEGSRTRADALNQNGNAVGAAILLTQAGAMADLRILVERIRLLLKLSDAEVETWSDTLQILLPLAAHHPWGQEARLLYDIQSACAANEKGIYTVDLVEWAMSAGELPIKRQLPGHQGVVILRHWRRALDRLRYANVTDLARHRLTQLLQDGVTRREAMLRGAFRHVVAAALDEVRLRPDNAVENAARNKLVEELLDRIVEVGHLNIGNLRDAISRNQLKLPDLHSPNEFFQGDPLIRLNRRLAVDLDGVYRRGEIYMRLLHRLSSLPFGTHFGRLLLLFLILPIGLAFFTMITPEIMVEEGEKLVTWIGRTAGMTEPPPEIRVEGRPAHPTHQLPMPNWWGVAGLAVFYLLLFNVGSFRTTFFWLVGKIAGGFLAGIYRLIKMPALQAILRSPFWTPFRRIIFWPVLSAFVCGGVAWYEGLGTPGAAAIASGSLVFVLVLLNTYFGRNVEEALVDQLLRYWVWLTLDLIPGLIHMIMDASRWCLEAVEQMLYTVNEWLSFQQGENRLLVGVKAILGLFWFMVTYVIRFAVNLLIEPQINPIKHFPVVTVSHKFCLPMIPTLADVLRSLGVRRPYPTSTAIIFGIPGIFGFMVWELKENWKLYRANRAAKLKPVMIGSHGETMLRLLRPGFHSGTIPKLYKRLRRAELRGQMPSVRKLVGALHHVAESIEHFVEREMLTLLRQSESWGGWPIEITHVKLATNRVTIEISRQHAEDMEQQRNDSSLAPATITFEQQDGWLLAGVAERGWLKTLSDRQRQVFALALAGLYKLAGVHLVREQLAEFLPATTNALIIRENELILWRNGEAANDVCYSLTATKEMTPAPCEGHEPFDAPTLDADQVLFYRKPLGWSDWVHAWQVDRLGESIVDAGVVLPRTLQKTMN